MKTSVIGIFLLTLLFGCNNAKNNPDNGKLRQQIIKTENDFSDLAVKEGIPTAFLAYADSNAVINRRDSLYKGIAAIRNYFEERKDTYDGVHISWKPDFVYVSKSGDLAYTYGHYHFSKTDSEGLKTSYRGVFHTVWKRQSDGSWRYVYN